MRKTGRWLAQYIENIPIVKLSNDIENDIVHLLKEKNYKAINNYVYSIYNLSSEEIDFIENQ
ncbi:MAG: hypothetical protein GX638_14920 [Crenarchaeota archaeon]|nr:hypothetical protein [Thermoproteota archaeon]